LEITVRIVMYVLTPKKGKGGPFYEPQEKKEYLLRRDKKESTVWVDDVFSFVLQGEYSGGIGERGTGEKRKRGRRRYFHLCAAVLLGGGGCGARRKGGGILATPLSVGSGGNERNQGSLQTERKKKKALFFLCAQSLAKRETRDESGRFLDWEGEEVCQPFPSIENWRG